MHLFGNSPIWQNPQFKLRFLTIIGKTREFIILDIILLIRFATIQRFKDINNSTFSRSRVNANFSAFKLFSNLPMSSLLRDFFDFQFYLKTLKRNQRSEEILDVFATIFASFEDFFAIRVIRNWEKKVVQMIIEGMVTYY